MLPPAEPKKSSSIDPREFDLLLTSLTCLLYDPNSLKYIKYLKTKIQQLINTSM